MAVECDNENTTEESQMNTEQMDSSSTAHDHGSYTYQCNCSANCQCNGCSSKDSTIKNLQNAFNELKEASESVKVTVPIKTKKAMNNITKRFLANDNKVKVYTGLSSRHAFNNLLSLVSHKASNMRYWSGCSKSGNKGKRAYKRTPQKPGPKRRTTVKEELLMVLMKLCLGLIYELLADLFGISAPQVSQIFQHLDEAAFS